MGQFFVGESQSRIYPNMCAKFGCVSKKKWGDRQTDKGTLQLYIVDKSLIGAKDSTSARMYAGTVSPLFTSK